MSWVTFTEADVLVQFSPGEQAAYDSSHGSEKLPGVCTNVVAEIRGYLAARTTLGASGTIPDSLLRTAAVMARYVFLNSLPVKGLLTEERVKEYERSMEYLREISRGDVPVPVDDSGGMEVVSSTARLFTRTTLEGL